LLLTLNVLLQISKGIPRGTRTPGWESLVYTRVDFYLTYSMYRVSQPQKLHRCSWDIARKTEAWMSVR